MSRGFESIEEEWNAARRLAGEGPLILMYICEADVEAYLAQGWQARRLSHRHGARKGAIA